MDILSRFKQSLESRPVFRPGEKIFVACSGGPDSVALYFLMKNAFPDLRPGLLHFNHKLRKKASDADEKFVRSLARKEKVPFVLGTAGRAQKNSHKKSIEEAARHERYAFFQQAARKNRISKIVTAHTLDDQAETILMRVLQGTGPQGLAGIRRSFKFGQARFARPLLDFSKKELLDYLRENRIRYRQDASNKSEKFLRNRIRGSLLPRLEREFNPRVREALARIPAILEEENDLLESLKAEAWKKCFKRKRRQELDLKRRPFYKLPRYLQFSVLDTALKTLDPMSGMSFEAWQRIKPRLDSARFRYSLPKEVDLEMTPTKLGVYKRKPLQQNRLPKQSRG
jgi:tRNA(Ile)-lysidine synthase